MNSSSDGAGALPEATQTSSGAPNAGGSGAASRGASGTSTPATSGDAQLPAIGDAATVLAWLDSGAYKAWACESERHAARPGSGHSSNRICSNAALSGHPDGAGEFPIGSAGVKELYNASGNVIGFAMYRKLAAGAGDSWWWYEGFRGSVVANGRGDSGSAKSVCTGCHALAGSSATRTGHDSVYTQVR